MDFKSHRSRHANGCNQWFRGNPSLGVFASGPEWDPGKLIVPAPKTWVSPPLRVAYRLSSRNMVVIEEDVKVVRVGNSVRIAIPAVFCKALGILEGDTVHLESTDHEILVRKLESVKTTASKKRG